MTHDLLARAMALFDHVVELPSAERAAHVVEACGKDAALRSRVLAMLAADERAQPLLDARPAHLAEALAEPTPTLAGRQVGPYVVREVIGRGGMGIVCRAEREDVGKRVALKLVAGALGSPDRVRRFLVERRLLAQLDHPNIVPLLDAGASDDGTPWLAMEYVSGQPIDAYCALHGLTFAPRLHLFTRVCDAVAYAHRHLIVHRDIKPSNVMVADDGEPRLLDFGIARLLAPGDEDRDATLTGAQALTPRYASPEQLDGAPVSTSSDIYQLGVLLRELTTGAAARLPGDVAIIIAKATEREPQRRYSTVEQLADDVQRYLDGRPIAARRATALYEVRTFIRRHRVGSAVASGALLALAAVSVTLWAQNRRIVAQRQRADQVAALLTDVFAGADPSRAQGDTVSARGVLDRGALRIQSDRSIAPEVKGQLLSVIARSYNNLGQTQRAIALQRQGLSLLDDVPPDEPHRLHGMQLLATWSALVSDFRSATALIDEATRIAQRLPGSRRAELAQIVGDRGFIKQLAGNDTGARRDYEESIAVYRSRPPGERAEMEQILVNLGYLAQGRGDLREARRLFHEVLDMRIARLGRAHSLTAKSMMDLAGVLVEPADLDSADALLREALATHRRVYAGPHRDVLGGLTALASLQARRGKPADAEATQGEALALARRIFGDSSRSVAMAVANLAGYVQAQGRLTDAARLSREAVDRLSATSGGRSPAAAVAKTNLAWIEFGRHELVRSAQLYEESIPVLDSAWKGSARIAPTLTDHAIVLQALRRCNDAEPLLRRALALASTERESTHVSVLRPMRALGVCLGQLGRLAEAESLLATAHELLRSAYGPANQYTASAARDLAEIRRRRW